MSVLQRIQNDTAATEAYRARMEWLRIERGEAEAREAAEVGMANALAELEKERAEKAKERAQKETALAEKEAALAEKETALAEKESERAQKETERAEKAAALREIDRLRARLRERGE